MSSVQRASSAARTGLMRRNGRWIADPAWWRSRRSGRSKLVPGLFPERERDADPTAAAVLDRRVAERDAFEQSAGRVGMQRSAGRPAEPGAGVAVDRRRSEVARNLRL